MRVIDRTSTSRGELVLREGDDADGNRVYDLLNDGVFLMDSAGAESEEQLADTVLKTRAAHRGLHVLVGGLGFGFTARAALRYAAVSRVDIVEIEPALIEWARGPLRPFLDPVLTDPRVEIFVADVRDHLTRVRGKYDVILLDVDNGPDFLSNPENADLYTQAGLALLAAAKRPGGEVAIWSAEASPAFVALLEQRFAETCVLPVTVRRAGRELCYTIYRAH